MSCRKPRFIWERWVYCVAYRPLLESGAGRVETWPFALAVGQALPTVPLALEAERCVPVELEAVYLEACRRRRLDEVTE
jgi:hypothetical protein